MNMEIPEWVPDAVFYQVFPDRFASSAKVLKPSNLEPWDSPPTHRGFKGGDLIGVAERLDYLSDLGINALYLNPIFQSAANHRYHTHDYYQVDPILGGNSALRRLLDHAHERGMRVILDGVFNHASRGFFQFHHILENGPASPYLDWFVVERWPLHPYDEHKPANYRAWWSNRELPAFDTRTPDVREFLFEVAAHWLEFGADGWRLDVPEEIDDPAFWREFRRRVRRTKPDAYLVGEIWSGPAAQPWLMGDQFDAVMNYPLYLAWSGFLGGQDLDTSFRPGGFELRRLTAEEFAHRIDEIMALHAWEVNLAQLNLLGSHDTPRFSTVMGGGEKGSERLKLAGLAQMTFPGVPCIYYGDEIGLEGREEPACRGAFSWDSDRWNADLRASIRRFVRLRRSRPALRRGSFARVLAQDGVYAFERALGEDRLLVVLNREPRSQTVTLPANCGDGRQCAWRDVWTGDIEAGLKGTPRTVQVGPVGGRVLERVTN
jgi:neopullulanase